MDKKRVPKALNYNQKGKRPVWRLSLHWEDQKFFQKTKQVSNSLVYQNDDDDDDDDDEDNDDDDDEDYDDDDDDDEGMTTEEEDGR